MKKIGWSTFYWFVGLLMVVGILGIVGTRNESGEVSAHPVNELSIDSGTKEEFVIPKDATGLLENIKGFEGYKQSLNYKGSIEKANFESFSTHSGMGLQNSIALPDNSYMLLISERNDVGVWNGQPWAATSYLLKVNKHGKVIKRLNIPTGKDIYVSSADNERTGELALDVSGIFLQGDHYIVQYSGHTPTDKNRKNRLLKVDLDLNPLSYSDIDVSSSSEGVYRNQLWPSINTPGKNYNLGFRLSRTIEESNQSHLLDMQEIDLFTGKVSKTINLTLPAYSQLNMDFDKFRPGHEENGVTLAKVFNTSDNGYFITGYANAQGKGSTPVQRASFFVAKFAEDGKLEYYSSEEGANRSGVNGQVRIQEAISTRQQVYFTRSVEHKQTELVRYDVAAKKENIIKKFPIGATFTIVPNEDLSMGTTFDFYGTNYQNTGDLEGYVGAGVILGSMDKEFAIKSANYIHHTEGWIDLRGLFPSENKEEYFAVGLTGSHTFSNVPQEGWWSTKVPLVGDANIFFGQMKRNKDYPPAIFQPEDIELNIEDPDLKSEQKDGDGWSTKDRWLITGSKKGALTDQKSIKVHDTYDLANPLLGGTIQERQNYLNRQINRNPLKKENEIDWSTLGVVFTKAGPQLVTYFIADAQTQVSTTSRWVNKETNQTVKEDKLYLDAQNFASPLITGSGSDTIDENTFKQKAQSIAWNGKTGEIYEEAQSGKFSSSVKVDKKQLAEVNQAKVAGPYPVDVTVTVANQVVKNRVWVFLTTKNTVVDKKSGTVIYANDYRLPLPLAAKESKEAVYRNTDVKVYDYFDSQHQDHLVLTTLADQGKTKGLSIVNLAVITSGKQPGTVRPEIVFDWEKGKTSTKPEVALYGELKVNVKQLILNAEPELIVPLESYVNFSYSNRGQVNLVGGSNVVEKGAPYRASIVDFGLGGEGTKVAIDLVIPENYQYSGYTISQQEITHDPKNRINQQYHHDLLKDSYEIWLTYYLEPTTKKPQSYSWSYRKNNFGEVHISPKPYK